MLSAQVDQTKSGSVRITDKNPNLFKHLLYHLKGYFNSHNGFFQNDGKKKPYFFYFNLKLIKKKTVIEKITLDRPTT